MKIVLSGEIISSESDFHRQFSKAFGIESFYGCNIHALWDVLSVGIERPINLVWKNAKLSQKEMGGDFEKIIAVLESVRLQDEEYGWKDKFTYSLD